MKPLGLLTLTAPFTLLCASTVLVSAGDRGYAKKDRPPWHADGVLTIGYRAYAPPFSFAKQTSIPGLERPAGYNVEICRQIAEHVVASHARREEEKCTENQECEELGNPPEEEPKISVEWRKVDASSRFQELSSGKIDLLCGTPSVTLERLRDFESSLFIFLTGASFLCKDAGNKTGLQILAGKRVGYVGGSTSQDFVERLKGENEIGAEITPVEQTNYRVAIESLRLDESKACTEAASKSEQDDTEQDSRAGDTAGASASRSHTSAESNQSNVLAGGENNASGPEGETGEAAGAVGGQDGTKDSLVDCVFGDRDILAYYHAQMKNCEQQSVYFDRIYYSLEPYAIFVRRGQDPDLLFEVNRRLVELFREDRKSRNSIHSIFEDFFGSARMSNHLQMLFEVQKLPLPYEGEAESKEQGASAAK